MSIDLDVQSIRGAFLIHRDGGRRGGTRRHDTFSAAEREAERLLGGDPDAVYIITREEARVSRRRKGQR